MTLPERLYRMLLWLYPGEHRQVYGEPMLQHARDMARAAQKRGRLQVFLLYFHLLKDGLANAVIERLEGRMNKPFKPVPWVYVLLAAFPGLLVTLSRRNSDALGPLLPALGYLYLALLVIGLPVIWWRERRFPVWALLPAGVLVWLLAYLLATALPSQIYLLPILRWAGRETWAFILILLLSAGLFFAFLQGRRLPVSFWLVLGVIVFGNLVFAIFYSFSRHGVVLIQSVIQYFTLFGVGPVDGFLLLAVGLFAARQHGLLALLFIVGGYHYFVGDTDFISGFLLLDWAWYPVYLYTLTVLYLVAIPIALLRARTRTRRVLALFVPLVVFHAARIIVPALVLQRPFEMPWGEIVLSINVLLLFVLAWILYDQFEQPVSDVEMEDSLEPASLPG
jgi:hypothetical protein